MLTGVRSRAAHRSATSQTLTSALGGALGSEQSVAISGVSGRKILGRDGIRYVWSNTTPVDEFPSRTDPNSPGQCYYHWKVFAHNGWSGTAAACTGGAKAEEASPVIIPQSSCHELA